MRPACYRRSGVTALAGGLLLFCGAPTDPQAADGSSALHVTGYRVIGNLVEVTLANPIGGHVEGLVVLAVVVDGTPTELSVPFRAWGAQKVFVKWAAPAAIDQIIRVGIIVDDGAPL